MRITLQSWMTLIQKALQMWWVCVGHSGLAAPAALCEPSNLHRANTQPTATSDSQTLTQGREEFRSFLQVFHFQTAVSFLVTGFLQRLQLRNVTVQEAVNERHKLLHYDAPEAAISLRVHCLQDDAVLAHDCCADTGWTTRGCKVQSNFLRTGSMVVRERPTT